MISWLLALLASSQVPYELLALVLIVKIMTNISISSTFRISKISQVNFFC